MKRKKDPSDTSWSTPRTNPAEIKALDQAVIDREQSKQIDNLIDTDRSHDKILLLCVVLGVAFFIWLSALTGAILYK